MTTRVKDTDPFFDSSDDGTDDLANTGLQYIDIYHVPTGQSIQFKAMLTQFEDTYTSEWNAEPVFGRMDSLQTYQRTGRSISVGFDIVSYSLYDAGKNMMRLSALIQFLYPTYTGDDTMAASPLCKIQFKNWSSKLGMFATAKLDGLLGGIKGLSFSPDLEAGVFVDETFDKIPLPKPEGDLYAKKMNVSFTYDVIHEHKLGWKKGEKNWIARDENGGELFPYGQPVDMIVTPDPFDHSFGNPTAKAQEKAVPNDEKKAATGVGITSPLYVNGKKQTKPGAKQNKAPAYGYQKAKDRPVDHWSKKK